MTLPTFLLGMLIASIIGAAFHLARGGGLGRLITFLIFSWIGFWLGHGLGEVLSIHFISIGPLRLGMAIVACLLALLLANFFSAVDSQPGE